MEKRGRSGSARDITSEDAQRPRLAPPPPPAPMPTPSAAATAAASAAAAAAVTASAGTTPPAPAGSAAATAAAAAAAAATGVPLHPGTTLPARKQASGRRRRTSTPRKWEGWEDEALRAAVASLGERSWKDIAEMVPGRNHVQCLQRWKKVLRPGLVKGHWTAHEDALLRELVCAGLTHWGQVSGHIFGRTAKQCRERWCNHLDPTIKRGQWTAEEDAFIQAQQSKMGNRWSQISAMMPGRTENAVKIRWKSLNRRKKARGKAAHSARAQAQAQAQARVTLQQMGWDFSAASATPPAATASGGGVGGMMPFSTTVNPAFGVAACAAAAAAPSAVTLHGTAPGTAAAAAGGGGGGLMAPSGPVYSPTLTAKQQPTQQQPTQQQPTQQQPTQQQPTQSVGVQYLSPQQQQQQQLLALQLHHQQQQWALQQQQLRQQQQLQMQLQMQSAAAASSLPPSSRPAMPLPLPAAVPKYLKASQQGPPPGVHLLSPALAAPAAAAVASAWAPSSATAAAAHTPTPTSAQHREAMRSILGTAAAATSTTSGAAPSTANAAAAAASPAAAAATPTGHTAAAAAAAAAATTTTTAGGSGSSGALLGASGGSSGADLRSLLSLSSMSSLVGDSSRSINLELYDEPSPSPGATMQLLEAEGLLSPLTPLSSSFTLNTPRAFAATAPATAPTATATPLPDMTAGGEAPATITPTFDAAEDVAAAPPRSRTKHVFDHSPTAEQAQQQQSPLPSQLQSAAATAAVGGGAVPVKVELHRFDAHHSFDAHPSSRQLTHPTQQPSRQLTAAEAQQQQQQASFDHHPPATHSFDHAAASAAARVAMAVARSPPPGGRDTFPAANADTFDAHGTMGSSGGDGDGNSDAVSTAAAGAATGAAVDTVLAEACDDYDGHSSAMQQPALERRESDKAVTSLLGGSVGGNGPAAAIPFPAAPSDGTAAVPATAAATAAAVRAAQAQHPQHGDASPLSPFALAAGAVSVQFPSPTAQRTSQSRLRQQQLVPATSGAGGASRAGFSQQPIATPSILASPPTPPNSNGAQALPPALVGAAAAAASAAAAAAAVAADVRHRRAEARPRPWRRRRATSVAAGSHGGVDGADSDSDMSERDVQDVVVLSEYDISQL